MSHIVTCDRCDGDGCVKCGYNGRLVINDPRRSRKILGVFIWTVLFAVLATWVIMGARPAIPFPSNYLVRLSWLNGYAADAKHGFNCSDFIANAHGDDYIGPDEFYAGAEGRLRILAEFSERSDIDERQLLPGDVIAFHGVHVAAYLGNGTWIDADTRRGNVGTFKLEDKPASDPWFAGKVRVLRWIQ